MAHMGQKNEDDLANPVRTILKANEGVEVLSASHTHQEKPSWKLGNVLFPQASFYGINSDRVDLTLHLDSRKLVRRRAFTVLMDKHFDLDPVVMELALPELRKAEEPMARKLETVKETISGKGRGNRLTILFCEIFGEALKRNTTPVEGVFHGTFGMGDLALGEISVADCWRMLPHKNSIHR